MFKWFPNAARSGGASGLQIVSQELKNKDGTVIAALEQTPPMWLHTHLAIPVKRWFNDIIMYILIDYNGKQAVCSQYFPNDYDNHCDNGNEFNYLTNGAAFIFSLTTSRASQLAL